MYDYATTPQGIHIAVADALRQEELVRPGALELSQVQKREKLPTDEKQLHSLLMTEGDLAAGDLDIPVEWLENLSKEGRVLYLEQGLWIAAEQEAAYHAALEEENKEEACSIVRRMLRYRGGASVRQVALRYNWQEEKALELLKTLCGNGEIVSQEESFDKEKVVVYYHAQLYKRARNKTLKNRREEIFTCPPQAYAALLSSRMQRSAPSEECLKMTVSSFA